MKPQPTVFGSSAGAATGKRLGQFEIATLSAIAGVVAVVALVVGFAESASASQPPGPGGGGGDDVKKFRCDEYEWIDQLPDGSLGGCGCVDDDCEVAEGGECSGPVLQSQQQAECVEDENRGLTSCNVYAKEVTFPRRYFLCDSTGDDCAGGCVCTKRDASEQSVRQTSTCHPPPGQGDPAMN